MSDKEDLVSRLSKKLKDEGYVAPSISAINPEMRTGNWCGSAAFKFMSVERTKSPSYVWVTQTVVQPNDMEEYLSRWKKAVYPELTGLVRKKLLKDVKVYQQILGGEYTTTFMLSFDSMANIEEFLKEMDCPEESKEVERDTAEGVDDIKRINELVQKRADSLFVEVM